MLGVLGQDLQSSVYGLETWLPAWQKALANQEGLRKEFEVPMRIAEAVLSYRRKPDERVLLALAAEEREVAREILGLDEDAENQD